MPVKIGAVLAACREHGSGTRYPMVPADVPQRGKPGVTGTHRLPDSA